MDAIPDGATADDISGRYVLPDASVGGKGLRPEARTASWGELPALAYGPRK